MEDAAENINPYIAVSSLWRHLEALYGILVDNLFIFILYTIQATKMISSSLLLSSLIGF